MTDVRCADCADLAVECPKGYFGGRVDCDVCGFTFALTAAKCAPTVACPKCGGTVTYKETKDD